MGFKILFIFSTYVLRFLCLVLPVLLIRTKHSLTPSILYLEVLPEENAGYYFRVKGWKDIAEQNGYFVKSMFLQRDRFKFESHLAEKRYYFLLYSLWRRFYQLISSRNYSCIIVRRELLLYNDYGNLFLEKFLLRINKRVILDFDDDISSSKREPRQIESVFGKLLGENGTKFLDSLNLYPAFFPCSEYLKTKLKEVNPDISEERVAVIPTCVNYDIHMPKQFSLENEPLKFGWVGGTRNLGQLDILHGHLNSLAYKGYQFELIVVSGKDYHKSDAKYPIVNISWSPDKQIENIKVIDVGLMPLADNCQNKGKCGLKLIQYMGLGIPGVASALTVNKEIVDDGEDGWLVHKEEDWEAVLEHVLVNRKLIPKLGQKAREKILNSYSFQANSDKYFNLINELIKL